VGEFLARGSRSLASFCANFEDKNINLRVAFIKPDDVVFDTLAWILYRHGNFFSRPFHWSRVFVFWIFLLRLSDVDFKFHGIPMDSKIHQCVDGASFSELTGSEMGAKPT